MRGDAESVATAATRLRPTRIAFDFDRTVCSTKSGAMPIVGKHTVDMELVALMWQYPCAIVTR